MHRVGRVALKIIIVREIAHIPTRSLLLILEALVPLLLEVALDLLVIGGLFLLFRSGRVHQSV